MTGREAINIGAKTLDGAGIEAPMREAAFILAHLLNCTPPEALLAKDIPTEIASDFQRLVEKRASGKPLQLILGHWEFFGRPIKIHDGVFIPRQETEGLVELSLELIPQNRPTRALEIGVGSGAIAINLLCELPLLTIIATDISEKALVAARKNAEMLGVSNRLELVLADITGDVTGNFDLIISNPPYVLSGELLELPREVSCDPRLALDGGYDGLSITRRIVRVAEVLLASGGALALEIHEDMGERVLQLLEHFVWKEIRRDLMGKERFVVARIGDRF